MAGSSKLSRQDKLRQITEEIHAKARPEVRAFEAWCMYMYLYTMRACVVRKSACRDGFVS